MEQPDLRKRLWNSAYDRLVAEEPRLVNKYERILSLQLHGAGLSLEGLESQMNDIEQNDQGKRLLQFSYIAEATFTRIRAKVSIEQGIKGRSETLSLVNEMISKALKAVHEVATPWIGFCLTLEVIFHCRWDRFKQTESCQILLSSIITEGVVSRRLAYVIPRMDFYWNLSVLFLDENRTCEFTQESRSDLEIGFIKLYMDILLWQMVTICSYFRQPEANFLLESGQSASWIANKSDFKWKKAYVLRLTHSTSTENICYYLNSLENTAMLNEIKLRNLYSDNSSFVCHVCGNLDTTVWGASKHSIYVIDIRHSSLECPACDIIISGLSKFVETLDESAILALFIHRSSSLRVEYHWGCLSSKGNRNLEFYIEEGLPKPWPAVGNGRTLQVASRSRNMQLISRWFRQCLTEHRICEAQRKNLPTRVLYVGNESREPYLYETCNEETQYTALSHCWGGVQDNHLLTTREVFGDRKHSIPIATLPQTFIDAVLLTRNLGIEYIWIDSLCIIQDDEEDWARESARMAEVYQNATLTISADGAANASEGLFETSMKRSMKGIPIQPKHTADSSLVYVRETIFQTYGDQVHVIGHKEEAPLRHRGWALQEWLLSTRIVHFTMGEILWECNDIQLCECQVTSQLRANSQREVKQKYYRTGKLDWAKVVTEFSKRQLTKETDRLPALSGLAASAKANAEADYVAGLWKSELPEALLWQVDGDESRRHDKYYAPTWSWASIIGRIDFPFIQRNGHILSGCKILELSTTLAMNNPFGALKEGFIKLKGAVGKLPKNMRRMCKSYNIGGEGAGFDCCGELVVDVKELAIEKMSAAEIPFLIIRNETSGIETMRGIALESAEEGSGTFKRVGYIWISYKGNDWESWIRDDLRVSEQTITII